MKIRNHTTPVSVFAGVILALLPFLNIYDSPIPFLSFGQASMFFVILVSFFVKKVHLKPFFLSFTIYAIIVSFFNLLTPWIIVEDVIHDILAWLFFIIIVIACVSIVDSIVFFRVLRIFSFASLSFFLVQFVLDMVGIRIIGIIPFLPLSGGDLQDVINKQLNSARLSGLFMEPAHYCQFMSLFLMVTLLSDKGGKKYDITIAIVTSLSILLSHSTSGMILVAIAWIMWFRSNLTNLKFNKVLIVGVFLMFVVAYLFSKGDESSMHSVTERLSMNYLSGGAGEGHFSSYIRVVRGYIPFLEEDFFSEIIGSGLGSHHSYVVSHPGSAFLSITSLIPNWINSMSYLLFSTGLIGTILYFRQLFKLYKNNTLLSKGLVLCILALFLSADSLFLIYQFLYVIIINKKLCLNIK